MGRKKAGSTETRILQKQGGSTYVVSIPIRIIRERGWQEGQKLVIEEEGDKLVIRDWEEE